MNTITLIECWTSLFIAIVFGVLGTVSMKLCYVSRQPKQVVSVAIFYVISFIAMTFSMQYLDLSVVYAIWSGLGTLLVAGVGYVYFNESMSLRKIIFLLLIVIGVIGIHFSDGIYSI